MPVRLAGPGSNEMHISSASKIEIRRRIFALLEFTPATVGDHSGRVLYSLAIERLLY